MELEHAGQGGQVQQLRLGELQGTQRLDEGLRKLLVSDCLTECRPRARARTSLVGANTVNGPGPDRASASLACGERRSRQELEKKCNGYQQRAQPAKRHSAPQAGQLSYFEPRARACDLGYSRGAPAERLPTRRVRGRIPACHRTFTTASTSTLKVGSAIAASTMVVLPAVAAQTTRAERAAEAATRRAGAAERADARRAALAAGALVATADARRPALKTAGARARTVCGTWRVSLKEPQATRAALARSCRTVLAVRADMARSELGEGGVVLISPDTRRSPKKCLARRSRALAATSLR